MIPVLLIGLSADEEISAGLYAGTIGCMFLIQVFILVSYYFCFAKIRFNPQIFLLAWTFAAAQAFTILVAVIKGTEIDSLDYINTIARFICVFLFLYFPSCLSISKKGLEIFMSLIVALGIIACIYNMLINFSEMMSIFTINNPYAVNFTAFFGNRNSFAQFLLFTIIANTFLCCNKKSIINWIVYLVAVINVFTTISRTAIAAICVFGLFFCLIYFRKKVLALSAILIGIGLIILFIGTNKELNDFIINVLIRENVGTSSRSDLWLIGLDLLEQSSWILGTGYFSSVHAIANNGYNLHKFHNLYIETLAGGGIVDLLLHIAVFTFAIIKIKNFSQHDLKTGILYFSAYAALILYASFESVTILSLGYVSTIFTIFFITMPILYSNGMTAMYKS